VGCCRIYLVPNIIFFITLYLPKKLFKWKVELQNRN
jgi:hypothetical protein